MSQLSELIAGMTDFFHRILNLLPNWVKRIMPEIIGITKAIREAAQKGEDWLSSQTAETIVSIIPGESDDKIRAGLLIFLRKAIPFLIHVEDKEAGLGELLLAFIAKLSKSETPKCLDAGIQALSSTMLCLHDGSKMSENRYDTLSQMAYSHFKKD